MWTVKVRREERGAKVEVRLKEKIPGVFWPVHQAIRRGEVTEVVAKGGRGSGIRAHSSCVPPVPPLCRMFWPLRSIA